MASCESALPLHEESHRSLVALPPQTFDETLSVATARATESACRNIWATEIGFDGKREEYFIPTPEVTEGIPVYVYVPSDLEASPPIVVYFHGGGFVLGDRLAAETTCKTLATEARCIYVNVEYRLAPEHKFPAGLDDSCLVTKWVLENRVKIGGDASSKVGVSGDSSGGQIAASVAHEVPGLSFQILIYPRVGAPGDYSLPSYQEFIGGPVISSEMILWFQDKLGEISGDLLPRFSNLLRDKFEHLPPCLFIVAEIDSLRDDSYEYARKLTAAGVHSELVLVKGAIHAFYTKPTFFPQLSGEAYKSTGEFIRKWGCYDNGNI